jgi:hypothetical protein
MNYDVVVNFGCSFMNGDRIVDKDGIFIGEQFVSAKLLSKKLNCNYIHFARTGSSNERIIKNIYNWVESNTTYKSPLIIIGLSGTARWMFYSKHLKNYFDLQPAQIKSYDDIALQRVNKKVTNNGESVHKLREWLEYYMSWIYDINEYDLKLQRSVMMLHHYLKGNNCDYRIHNSLEDSLDDIKDKINFLSFKDEDYKGEDCWYGYLRWQMENIDKEQFESIQEGPYPVINKFRSPVPPYGKRFCEGHPSPNANKELCDRIYESLK